MIQFAVARLAKDNFAVVLRSDLDENNNLKNGRKPISSYHRERKIAEAEREKIEQKFGDNADASNSNI